MRSVPDQKIDMADYTSPAPPLPDIRSQQQPGGRFQSRTPLRRLPRLRLDGQEHGSLLFAARDQPGEDMGMTMTVSVTGDPVVELLPRPDKIVSVHLFQQLGVLEPRLPDVVAEADERIELRLRQRHLDQLFDLQLGIA